MILLVRIQVTIGVTWGLTHGKGNVPLPRGELQLPFFHAAVSALLYHGVGSPIRIRMHIMIIRGRSARREHALF